MLKSISNKPINDNEPPTTGFVKNNKNFFISNNHSNNFPTKLMTFSLIFHIQWRILTFVSTKRYFCRVQQQMQS